MTEYVVPPREGQSLAVALEQIRDAQLDLLAVSPDDGDEGELDALAMAAFRLDPPAFLLKSVK
jgi:hypothetical protein